MENSDKRYVMEWINQLERRERNQWTTKKDSDYFIRVEKQRFFSEMSNTSISRICKTESDVKELKKLLKIK